MDKISRKYIKSLKRRIWEEKKRKERQIQWYDANGERVEKAKKYNEIFNLDEWIDKVTDIQIERRQLEKNNGD